ncbi:hypothetical protein [Arthrobacter sp. G119Y2]|uniref:hypothetical protein n=1 Tax=Arthrobacter sp. G119Y2 TaxID=3134965 RepID=UPI003119B49F
MKGLRADAPVLLTVWVLCVTTDWSTGTKIALNIAAVAGLCLKEYLVHRNLQHAQRTSRRAAEAAGAARSRVFAAA